LTDPQENRDLLEKGDQWVCPAALASMGHLGLKASLDTHLKKVCKPTAPGHSLLRQPVPSQDLQGRPGYQENLVLRVTGVQWARSQSTMRRLEFKLSKVPRGLRAKLARWVHLDKGASVEREENLDGQQELACPVDLVKRVNKVTLAHQGPREKKATTACTAKWAWLALEAQVDLQAKMANWVTRDHLDSLASLAPQVKRATTETLGLQG